MGNIDQQLQFSSVQSLSHVWLFATPWAAARQASQSITNSRSLPKLISIESVMPSNHLILCHPLLLLPSIFPSIGVFSNESALRMRWPKYWSFSFNIIPSKEHPGLVSFRMDWLDCLAVQGTLRSLLQHHSSKASILCCSAFFMVQLSHPYMTTGITLALTRWTFVGKVTASEVAKIWRPIWKSLWNDLHHSADGSVCVLYSWNGRNAKDQNALLTLRLRTQILDSDSLLPNYCSRNFFITLGKTFKMS